MINNIIKLFNWFIKPRLNDRMDDIYNPYEGGKWADDDAPHDKRGFDNGNPHKRFHPNRLP